MRSPRSIRFVAVRALVLATLALVTGCSKPPRPEASWIAIPGPEPQASPSALAPDILIVLVDTLRPDHLGSYGYGKPTSPYLDRWAQQARRYEYAFTNATHTRMAVASLFTGARPTVHRVRHVDKLENEETDAQPLVTDGLHEGFITIAESLRDAGYRTWGFSSNPHITHLLHFNQGFSGWWETSSRDGADMVAKVVGELDARGPLEGDRPLMAYVHFMDVHNPYAPPDPFDKQFAPDVRGKVVFNNGPADPSPEDLAWSIGQYDGDIRYFDSLLERLLARWETAGKRPRSVIILSDHGEEFMEHGGLGHGTSVFGEQARIALFIKSQRTVPGRSRSPVQTIDVTRAIYEIAQVSPPDTVQGRSLRSWTGPTPIYTESRTGLWSIRCGDLMTIQHLTDSKVQRVYNLTRDPQERQPGAAFGVTSDAQQQQLRFCFESFGQSDNALADRIGTPVQVTLGEETRDALKGLGYLGQ
ncbi:MAG: sulfatase [Acidobacteriota bacterium]